MPENIRQNLQYMTEGAEVKKLQEALQKVGKIPIAFAELNNAHFGKETVKAVAEFQKEYNLTATGVVDTQTHQKLEELMASAGIPRIAAGMVKTESGVDTQKLKVILYGKSVGGQEAILGEARLNPDGSYLLPYEVDGLKSYDVAVKIVDATNPSKILAESGIVLDTGRSANIDVEVPANSVKPQSEYSELLGSLKEAGAVSLKDLVENEQKQDISYMAHKTGWDARMIAMAVQAEQESLSTGLPAEYYYALYRAGMPMESAALHHVKSDHVKKVWKQASETNIIDTSNNQLERSLTAFEEVSKDFYLAKNPKIGVSSFQELLSAAIPAQKQSEIANLYYESSGDPDKFWKEAKARLEVKEINKLELVGKLGYLTLNNAPLVNKLETNIPNLSSPLDLVKAGFFEEKKWQEILTGVALPEQMKKEDYATYMANELRVAYPTAVVAEKVKKGDYLLQQNANREATYRFLTDNQATFRIGTDSVGSFEKKYGKIQDEPIRKELKSLSAAYQTSANDKVMEALTKHKISSAHLICQFSEQEFIDFLADEHIGEDMARATYAKAQSITATITNVSTLVRKEASSAPMPGIDDSHSNSSVKDNLAKGIGESLNIEQLFGNLDYSDCDQCLSVFSPAAYLVDILKFLDLRKLNSEGGELSKKTYDKENPLDVLLSRRPDIEHLELTCENTNTVLPYIDVVNEILEYWVIKNHGIAPDQQLGHLEGFNGYDVAAQDDTEDLLANPKYVDRRVYDDILLKQVFPSPLPFNYPLAALRQYLAHLKAPLAKVMEVLKKDNVEIDREQLGLSPEEYRILTDSAAYETATLFGESKGTWGDDLISKLTTAREFTSKTAINYQDLLKIIKTEFINSGAPLIPLLEKLDVTFPDISDLQAGRKTFESFGITVDSGEYGGNIEKWLHNNYSSIRSLILLNGIDEEFGKLQLKYALPDTDTSSALLKETDLLRLYRFIRIWKNTGWTIEETDLAFKTFLENSDRAKPDDTPEQLKQKLDGSTRKVLAGIARVGQVMALLKISGKDAAKAVLEIINPDGDKPEYRQKLLARVMKLKPADLELWRKVTAIDPVEGPDRGALRLLTFLKLVDLFKQHNIKPELLQYLFKNDDISGKLAPKQSQVDDSPRVIKGLLSKVNQETSFPDHGKDTQDTSLTGDDTFQPDNGSATADTQSLIPDIRSNLLKRSFAEWITDTAELPLEAAIALLTEPEIISGSGEKSMLEIFKSLENFEFKYDAGYFRFHLEVPQDGDYLFFIDCGERIEMELEIQKAACKLSENNSGVVHNIEVISLKSGELYAFSIKTDHEPETPLKISWASKGLAKAEIPGNYLYHTGTVTEISKIFQKIHKAGKLLKPFGFTANELLYFLREPSYNVQSKNFLNLIGDSELENDLIEDYTKVLKKLANYQTIKKYYKTDGDVLINALINPDGTDGQNNVPFITLALGWKLEDFKTLDKHFEIAEGQKRDVDRLKSMHEVILLQQASGIPLSRLIQWTDKAPDMEVIDDLGEWIENHYVRKEWINTLKPINDGLRMLRRDALVACILNEMSQRKDTEHINTSGKLFEFFLIDVDMTSRMNTSRLRQAISSVQLFVQRCLMNLETSVSPDSIKAKQWEWMKRYRLWEANRKIYVFPENWLEPELRHDKSELFKDLEGSLLQADITDEMAETAMFKYLSNLDSLAKLEIIGMYTEKHDLSTQTDDVIHVFGRTNGMSRKYYYRRYEYGYWTPWELANLDIEDTPVLPVVWKGRLFLFWLNIIMKGEDGGSIVPAKIQSSEQEISAKVTVEINLSWSEYFKGKWQTKKTSDFNSPMKTDPMMIRDFNRRNYGISAQNQPDGALRIDVSWTGSFVLYNTYSNPITQKATLDIWKPISTIVDLDSNKLVLKKFKPKYSEGPLMIFLGAGLSSSVNVLENMEYAKLMNQNANSVESNAGSMPAFFLENNKHLFFALRSEKKWTVNNWNFLGMYLSDIIDAQKIVVQKYAKTPISKDDLISPSPENSAGITRNINKVLPGNTLREVITLPSGINIGVGGSSLFKVASLSKDIRQF